MVSARPQPVGMLAPSWRFHLHRDGSSLLASESGAGGFPAPAARSTKWCCNRLPRGSDAHPEEMELGAAVIDIGGSTTDVAVFLNGSIAFSVSIHLADGGDERLDATVKTSPEEAERLKISTVAPSPS